MSVRRPLCLICLLFLFIIFICTGGAPPSPGWDVDRCKGLTVTVTGTVKDRQKKDETFLIRLTDVCFVSKPDTAEGTYFPRGSTGIVIRTDADSASYVKIGSRIEAKGVFAPFEVPTCEGQFDSRTYYMIRGYEGQLVRARITGISEKYDIMAEGLRRLRDRAVAILCDNMDEKDAGLVTAMTLGDKTLLDSGVKELYQQAGISHVLALSGLHIASVGLALLTLLKKSGLPVRLAALLAGGVIGLYAVMTGMSTSTARAMLMFALAVAL